MCTMRRDDAELQDILLCIQTGKQLRDSNRMRMNNDTYYLRSPEEMQNLFPRYLKPSATPSRSLKDARWT